MKSYKQFHVELIKFTDYPATERHIEVFRSLKTSYNRCRRFIKETGIHHFKSAIVTDDNNEVCIELNYYQDDHFYDEGLELTKDEFDALYITGCGGGQKPKIKATAKTPKKSKAVKPKRSQAKRINQPKIKKYVFEKIASPNGIVRYFEIVRLKNRQLHRKLSSKSYVNMLAADDLAEVYEYDTIEHDRLVWLGFKYFLFVKQPTATKGIFSTTMTAYKTLEEAQNSFKDVSKSIKICGGYIEDCTGKMICNLDSEAKDEKD